MYKKRKQGLLEISVFAVKIVLCCMLVFNTLFFIYYGIINKAVVEKREPFSFMESWVVKDSDGNEFMTGRSYMAQNADDRDYTISSTLPQNLMSNEYLFFTTRKDVAVYIGGELRADFVGKRDVNIPGGIVTRFYMMVPLKESDSGAEVRMVITGSINDEQIVPETFISTRYGEFSYLMRNGGFSFFLASIVLIFSIVVMIVSIVLRFWYKMKIDMMYGALGIFVVASWIVTDSYLFPYIFNVYYINGILNYMLCMMIPFALTIYLNSVQRGRYRKSMPIIIIVSCLNAITWPVLHFTGVLSFINIRTVGNLILVGMTAAAIVILLYDAIKGNAVKYRYTCIGFLGFFVCCTIELVKVLLNISGESVSMITGLGFLLAFIVIQQIDELRKINQEKQYAIDISEAKSRFLASMSHEIRTPINAILGMNEMILRENNDKVIGEYSRSIKTSGKMLLMLVNDVLDFSKIEAGKLEINESRFLMSDMLFDVISLVRERADEKKLELKTEIVNEIPNELISDEFRIRQILVNLINNAVKYTEKGTVTLKLGGSFTENGYELNLLVKDTGRGIRKEDQPHLFEAFSRADVKTNVNIEGTGLGLAIVKSIVDSMKGSVGVESEYGDGSEFWVKLPVHYVNKEPLRSDFMENRSSHEYIPESEGFTAEDARILAVDDNQSNLTIVKLFLKRTGIQMDLCSTGTRAVELCHEKKYDLILLDHMMPSPDGIETLHLIRKDKNSKNRDTKAVVLTANAVAGNRQMYLDEGFADYLTKPLDSKLLEQTVKNMLPQDKVHEFSEYEEATPKNAVMEWPAEPDNDLYQTETVKESSIRQKLSAVEGLDYDLALEHCAGDEDLLAEIISDFAAECAGRIDRMRKDLEAKDMKAYAIEAHTIKSSMATIGIMGFCEKAKKHEFAAKDNNVEFILKDAEGFFQEYAQICKTLE